MQPTHQCRQDQGNGERWHSVPHTHSEWTTGAGGYVPIPWVPDYRRWWVYSRILYQVKQRACDRGITAENMEKSQHTNFNEDTTIESASVVFSSVRLWKLDTQKEWRNMLTPLRWKDWEILQVSWTAKKTNEWVLNKAEVKRELLDTVRARKLAYYSHTVRKQGSCLGKEIMQGTMPGARRQGRPCTAWMDSIKMWTGLPVEESVRMTESMSMVWPTLGSRTAKEQKNRT